MSFMPSDDDTEESRQGTSNEAGESTNSVSDTRSITEIAEDAVNSIEFDNLVSEDTQFAMYHASEAVRDLRVSLVESMDWLSLREAVNSYFGQLSRVIANDIDGLESPEDYDPEQMIVTPVAERLGRDSLDNLISEIESEGYSHLEPFLARLKKGREHLENQQYGAASFYFISVQDGLMSLLCDHLGCSTNSDGYYGRSKKVNTFAGVYRNQEFYNVNTGEVIQPLGKFYDHRNAIVHGSPSAYLDKDIALVSLLFTMLTLNATVAELS